MNRQFISLIIIVLFLSLPFTIAQEREDLGEVININVNTYQPAVVPSNILAEQDVPVYAYLEGTTLGSLLLGNDAINLPPLYQLPKISRINIEQKNPSDFVTSIQYKTPYKKIYAKDDNSIDLGYLIVRLRKIKKENEIPDVINVNVTAKINFELDEGFSIFGTQDLILRESNDEENWEATRTEESAFWNKKGYVRAYNIKSGRASFEVYDGSFDTLTTLSDKSTDFVSSSIRFKTGEFEDSNLLDDRFRLKVQRISVPEPKANLRIIDSTGRISDKTVTKGMPIVEGSSYRVKEIRTRRPTSEGQVEEVIIQKGREKPIYLRTLYQSTIFAPSKLTTTTVPPATSDQPQSSVLELQPIINSIIFVESSGNPSAVSCTGPAGLMQLGVDAANEVRSLLGPDSEYPKLEYYPTVREPCEGVVDDRPACHKGNTKACRDESIDWRFNKDKNVAAGTQYLLKLINKYKDLRLALFAYNQGPGAADNRCSYDTPPTTVKFDYERCRDDDTTNAGKTYVNLVLNTLKERGGVIVDASKPIFLDETIVTVSTQTEVGSENPCANAKILSDEDIRETSSNTDLFCTAISELQLLIDNYHESPYVASAYELIGDIYAKYLKSKLLARENYEKALLFASNIQRDALDIKLKDLNKAIGESIDYGHAIIDDEVLDVTLLRVIAKEDNAVASLRIDSKNELKKVNDFILSGIDKDGNYSIHLIEIQSDFVRIIKTYSKEDNNNKADLPNPQRFTVTSNNPIDNELVEDKEGNKFHIIELLETDTKEEAIVTILPGSGKETSTSDFSLHIPIEKRALRFTPEEIDNKIARTKKLIEKLDSVINKLDSTLKVWKTTCLITFTVLTIKNSFFNPIKNLARRLTMRGPDGQSGWNKKCIDKVNNHEKIPRTDKEYLSLGPTGGYDKCIEVHNKEIEQEIEAKEKSIIKTKDTVKKIGDLKNQDSRIRLSEQIDSQLNEEQIKALYDIGQLGNEEAQNLILLKNSELETDRLKYQNQINSYKELADNEIKIKDKITRSGLQGEKAQQLELALRETDFKGTKKARELYESTTDLVKNYFEGRNEGDVDVKEVGNVYLEEDQPENTPLQYQKFYTFHIENNQEQQEKGLTRLLIGETAATLNGQQIFVQKDSNGNVLNYYVSGRGVSSDRCPRSQVYKGTPTIIYDEKGKPLIIPVQHPQIDNNYADYVEFTYDRDTNQPIRYHLFNVGLDGIISEINKNTSDDCEVSLNNDFNDNSQATKAVSLAYEQALKGNQLAKEKGRSAKIKVLGKEYFVNIATNKIDERLGPQCTDVFSLEDCHIMFGVCDPVICPSSRFDFGDTWKVDNVVQTGIVGSVLLGIKNLAPYEPVPICLTGVLAGLQNIKTILEGLNECLQTAKVKGEYVGICDAVTSIYICETALREGLALYRLKGKVINWISKDIFNRNPDGGEYLTFKNSLKNVEDSAKFFTKDYAQNEFKDYIGKSADEVGSILCRQAVYSSTPGVGKFLDQVLEPDSPPQFTAILNVFPWATLPDERRVTQEQSRYQVYYHVFAGNNKAIRYSVILKDPYGRQIYVTENPETVRRIRNSLEAGDYADKTIDFVAASGYDEICIEVDGLERCGFGSVTSAFSFNFLKDELVKNELSKKITNEKECIVTNSAVNPSISSLTNTQSRSSYGATYTGIRRECSLDNPAKGTTDAKNWEKIPDSDCGLDQRGRDLGYCWLYVNPEVLNLDYVQGNEALIQNLTGIRKEDVIILDDEEKTKERIDALSINERFNELIGLSCSQIEENRLDIIKKSNDLIRDSEEIMSNSIATDIIAELQFNIARIYVKLGECEYLKIQESESEKFSRLVTGISDVACTEEMALELKQEKEFRDYKIRLKTVELPKPKEPIEPDLPSKNEREINVCEASFEIFKGGEKLDCAEGFGQFSRFLYNVFNKELLAEGTEKYYSCDNIQLKLLECTGESAKFNVRTKVLSNSDKNRIEKDIRDAVALENQLFPFIQVSKIGYIEGESKILLELSGSTSLSLKQILKPKLDVITQHCRQTLEISWAAKDYEGEFQDTVDTIRADIRSRLSVFDLNAIEITVYPKTENEIRESTLQLQTDEFLSEQLVSDIQEYLNRYNIKLEIINANVICESINQQTIISAEECHGNDNKNPCYIKKDKKFLGLIKKSSCLPCEESLDCEDFNNDNVRCNDWCLGVVPFHCKYSDRANLCVV